MIILKAKALGITYLPTPTNIKLLLHQARLALTNSAVSSSMHSRMPFTTVEKALLDALLPHLNGKSEELNEPKNLRLGRQEIVKVVI